MAQEGCLVCQDLVGIFTCFYCLLDLSCGECDVISLYFVCFSVNGSVCVRELFGEIIRNMFGGGCYFVVECYGSA